MIEFSFIAFCVLVFIIISIIEHKQRMNMLEFEERLYRLKHQFLDDYTNDEKDETAEQ